MHRLLRIAPLVAVLGAALSGPALAQDAAPSFEGHPFVGAWLVDTNTDDSSERPTRLVVHPDGTLLQADQTTVAVGVWEPTGEASARITLSAPVDAGEGEVTLATLRGEIALQPGGDAWTAQATVEMIDEQGASSGQMGPIPAAATRIAVEPMTPEASPAF